MSNLIPAIYYRKDHPNSIELTINNEINMAEIVQVVDESNDFNPTIKSPNSINVLQFYETKESLDIENYKSFLDNAISLFRHSKFYKKYKEYLMTLGLNRCQLLGVTSEMATLEMHHNFLNIHDIAYMICEHVLNTVGKITTFQLVHLLKDVHRYNMVPIVMLSKTGHQIHHANKEFILPSQMCFGFWTELVGKFYRGISVDIGYKIIYFIESSLEYKESNYLNIPDANLLDLRKSVLDWSEYNEYTRVLQTNRIINEATCNDNYLYNYVQDDQGWGINRVPVLK